MHRILICAVRVGVTRRRPGEDSNGGTAPSFRAVRGCDCGANDTKHRLEGGARRLHCDPAALCLVALATIKRRADKENIVEGGGVVLVSR